MEKEQEADAFYEEQLKKIEPIMEKEDTGRTVAFFYITANGAVNVRKPNDYIAQMIGLAGGTYVLNDRLSAEENAPVHDEHADGGFFMRQRRTPTSSSTTVRSRGELYSVDELLAKSTLFSDFKAVKRGKCILYRKQFLSGIDGNLRFH